jgi:hypothetical protein
MIREVIYPRPHEILDEEHWDMFFAYAAQSCLKY